ncbi:hypothetical protein C4D60_Mb05t26140 [Musa balbisiana]|uniref:Uncharacterized protein n=1 Tax=Musa balbisiana TaxID=52838 RepID=A0A4S8JYY1_MUSBA|nr:hypothetical protein C4D60_Mb05t26140 [Musa balbisiana]
MIACESRVFITEQAETCYQSLIKVVRNNCTRFTCVAAAFTSCWSHLILSGDDFCSFASLLLEFLHNLFWVNFASYDGSVAVHVHFDSFHTYKEFDSCC